MLQAMFVSFGMAAESNGDCFLRYDDTNPEAEKLEYIEHIQDIVSWMGWKPYKVLYPSGLRCCSTCSHLTSFPNDTLFLSTSTGNTPALASVNRLLHSTLRAH